MRPKVLVMVDWYAPGFKAGGPIRSAVNFADQLEADLDIYVMTSDRDLGDISPYAGVVTDKWIHRNRHQVFYASPSFFSWKNVLRVIRDLCPEYIYMNSMFSRFGTVYPLMMKRMGKISARMILAPRGMLKASALSHKVVKKKTFLMLFRVLDLSRDIVFHVTDEKELSDVRLLMGQGVQVFKLGNLPGRMPEFTKAPAKFPGVLEMVFVGRFHQIKNLDFLLLILREIDGNVHLKVIATEEDIAYQAKCETIISKLPAHIRTSLLLNITHEQVLTHVISSHIFVLPTKGENFGHAIFESFAAGRPVLISNQTPWQNLKSMHCGWDLALDKPGDWRDAIEQAIGWSQDELDFWSKCARAKAEAYSMNESVKQSYLKQFE